MSQKKTKNTKNTIVAENRKAKYNYFIESKIECGVVLLGSEVKSLRSGSSNISESYASIEESELWLINSFFPKFDKAYWAERKPLHQKLDAYPLPYCRTNE